MAESSTRSRTRINREGIAFLTNYASTVNTHPSKAEKLDLLTSIRGIPGNEGFTLAKLTNWFNRYRSALHGDPLKPVLVDDETILFPKLTPMHLQQLRVLYKKSNDPTEGVITFWAKRINADRDEVVAWIQYQHEKSKEPEESPDVSPTVSEFPRPHLPTPAKSLSPQMRMPSLPPIAIKVEEKPNLSSFDLRKPPERSMPALPRLTLEQSIRDSLRSHTSPSDSSPETADEFAAQFERIEHMIDTFMQKHSSGQLAALGWDSSPVKSTS